MDKYIPPYDITDEMLELTFEIAEDLGRLNNVDELQRLPRLRKVNRIRSIQSSLAIENNTLSLEQVTAVIDGKRVLGPEEDIVAVKNAFNAYKMLPELDPFSLEDMKKAHGEMMRGLIERAGAFRLGGVGVFNERGEVIHVAPPYDMVPGLMGQLFDWLGGSKAHMLIRSSVFHYECEFIHPFADGNGRMGRLWQKALLASWKPIFMWVPVESIIKDNQEEYYKAIALSTSEGKSNKFILFMLGVIKKAAEEIVSETHDHQMHIGNRIKALMSVMDVYPMSALELMEKLGLKSRLTFMKNYLHPALQAGLIAMTDPNNPTSRNQRYYKI